MVPVVKHIVVSQINMVQSVSIYIYTIIIYTLASSGRPSGGLDSPWHQNALFGLSECPVWTSDFFGCFVLDILNMTFWNFLWYVGFLKSRKLHFWICGGTLHLFVKSPKVTFGSFFNLDI